MDRAAHRASLNRAEERGAAIVAAMLLAAIAATVAAALLSQQQWNLRQHHFRREQVQAQALVIAGLQWARQVLQEDARAGRIDYLGEPWALRLPPTPVADGEVWGQIDDEQSRFNVNNVVREGGPVAEQVEVLGRLLARAGADPALASAIAGYLDASESSAGSRADDARYRGMMPPRLPARRPLVRLAELAGVEGVSAESVPPLAALLSSLPETATINVNTAPGPVLQALIPELDADGLARIERIRAAQPFTSVADFRNRGLPGFTAALREDRLGVASRFFMVTVAARQGDTRARGRALLRREGGDMPSVVWQVVE